VTTSDVAAAAKFTDPVTLSIVCAPVVPPAVTVFGSTTLPAVISNARKSAAAVSVGLMNNPRVTPDKVSGIAKFAAQAAALELLDRHPEARPDLVKAKLILATLAAGQQWDIAQLAAAFQNAGFKELRGARGVLIVQGAILAADLSGHTVDLNSSDYAKAAILGALDGLNLVLQ